MGDKIKNVKRFHFGYSQVIFKSESILQFHVQLL